MENSGINHAIKVDAMPDKSDRRRFRRWKVAIPCTVKWENQTIMGKIANISDGGAFITGVPAAPPPKNTLVTLIVQYRDEGVGLGGNVPSRIVHLTTAAAGISGFGVEFVSN